MSPPIFSSILQAGFSLGGVATKVVGGIIVFSLLGLYRKYRGGNDDDDVSDGDLDQSPEQSPDQSPEQTVVGGDVVIGNGNPTTGPQSGNLQSDSQDEDPLVKCIPLKVGSGEPDNMSAIDDQIRTTDCQGLVRVIVKWKNTPKDWVLVDTESAVECHFEDKSPGVEFDGSRFKLEKQAVKKSFRINLEHPESLGESQMSLIDTRDGSSLKEMEIVPR